MESAEALSRFLVGEVRTIERGAEAARREAKEQVPGDRVKDASALARELRWRVRAALGYDSEEEAAVRGRDSAGKEARQKRKRESEEPTTGQGAFRNFRPKVWDAVKENDEAEVIVTKRSKPVYERLEQWAGEWEVRENGTAPDEVQVNCSKHIKVQVRRTAGGLERQRVERVVEQWTWLENENGDAARSSG